MCVCVEHYRKLASQYDKYYEALAHAKATLIQRLIPLTKDDQIVDIGGGTAQISLMIHSELKMIHPVVCIDPCQEMLDLASEKGVIAIQATAEEFLASKPDCHLKVVLMIGCIHHFKSLDFVFSKLSEYMPDDGVCVALEVTGNSLPMFKDAQQVTGGISAQLDPFYKALEANGLKCKVMSDTLFEHVNKELWFEAIRNRFSSGLLKFTDEELERGIQELENEFRDEDVLNFKIGMNGFVITKK